MRNARVFRALLGVEKTVIEDVEFDDVEEVLLASAAGSGRQRQVRGVSASLWALRRG